MGSYSFTNTKLQLATLSGKVAEEQVQVDRHKERADKEREFALTEKERGYALYQAIQQLAKAQDGRQYAQREIIDRFSIILYDFASKFSSLDDERKPKYFDVRDLLFELQNIINILTRDDVNSLIDIANQLYPELRKPDKR